MRGAVRDPRNARQGRLKSHYSPQSHLSSQKRGIDIRRDEEEWPVTWGVPDPTSLATMVASPGEASLDANYSFGKPPHSLWIQNGFMGFEIKHWCSFSLTITVDKKSPR